MTRPPPSLPLPDLHALPGRPDTSTCDREPIHVPASIQPHGLLLVLDPDTLRVLQAAGDMQHLLDIPLDAALGEEAGRFLPSDAIQALCTPAPAPQEPGPPRLPTGARLLSGVELRPGRFFDLQGRDSPAGIIVEIEPRGVPGPVRQDDTLVLVQGMIASLQGAATARPYCEAAAATIRDMTGFDRVMVYRFEPDDTGCVVAEARAEGTGSYLGLHFPASDIPKQARALYLRNWMRLIPDAHYIPEPLMPALSPRTGEALDMSDCSLRAVSPIHLQYLRNMGVQASMSLSIQQGGRLWGLIACHHRTAWHLPVALRAACEIFAQMFSLQLETLEQREDHEDALRMRRVHEHLEQVMAQEEELGEGLIRQRPNLLDYLEAGGVAVMASGRYATAGQTPTREQVNGLVEWLRGTVEERIVALDRLPELYPPSREFADVASGVLALSVSRAPQDYILWFRPEMVRTLHWAGNPDKPVEPGAGPGQLSPRASFATWTETVHGRARPWRAVEIEAAQALQLSLLEVVLRRIEDASEERGRARAQQDLLMAELDHRVKNTLANIQALVRHTKSGAGNLEGFVHDFDRRIRAMAVAHSLLTSTRWEGADLRALAEEELRPYRNASEQRVIVAGPEVRLKPKAALALSLALHELATNAAKYGGLSVPEGQVAVTWSMDGERIILHWVESGGPPVQPPRRRGFGSTVVERGLSYELGGQAKLNFDPAGLRCAVTIPLKQLVESAPASPTAAPRRPEPAPGTIAGRRILVVEDAALVAMQVSRALEDGGAVVVGPAAALAQAIRLAVSARIDAALLDVDLDGESVFPVADVLAERGIPFLFTTGFDAATIVPERFRGTTVLGKPYGTDDIHLCIVALLRDRPPAGEPVG
ncbi:HWE histidine kinase domain-containing protein [Roseomonas mucosa]